ncbi:MAG: diguanylate cyclase [Acidobacteria bacterium]|nr:diguanylate cyclase [Acidobacteriota bacterium]
MLLGRDELITTLFRETDRAQRLKTGLAVILCGIDRWERCLERLEMRARAEVEHEITRRIARVLRCYDSLGSSEGGEYCLILPGCNSFQAVGMAERLRQEAFGTKIFVEDEELALEACFGVAGSGGRSPLVVLRNAEQALRAARAQGTGSVERSSYDTEPDSKAFPIVTIDDMVKSR